MHMLLGFLGADKLFRHLLKNIPVIRIRLPSVHVHVSHTFGAKCKLFESVWKSVWKRSAFTKRVRQSVWKRLEKCLKAFGKVFVKRLESVCKVFATRLQNVWLSLKVFGKRLGNVGAFGVC